MSDGGAARRVRMSMTRVRNQNQMQWEVVD